MKITTQHGKKSHLAAVAAALMMAAVLTSCFNVNVASDDSPMTTKCVATDEFLRIRLQGSPTVHYTQADTLSVRVEAPEDMVDYVVAEVADSCLTIRLKDQSKALFRNGTLLNGDEVTVYVTSPDLVGVQLRGSGDFNSDTLVDTDNLLLDLRGSGTIKFNDIVCDHLTTTLTGSGDMVVKHVVAATSAVELVGSGDVEINHDGVASTDIMLKGSGDVEASFRQCGQVTAEVRGSGDIELSGTVQNLTAHKHGSGEVNTAQLAVQN